MTASATPSTTDEAATEGDPRLAERALALGYTPARWRPALDALFLLDRRLGDIVRSTREPMVGQMRLTWWYEALGALDRQEPPAEPVLTGLAATVLPRGVNGGTLAAMIDGWEVLLDDPAPDDAALARYAAARGGVLFAAAAIVLGSEDARLATLGEGWALADLAVHLSDTAAADRAAAMARSRLDQDDGTRWPRALRPLAALGLLARSDLDGGLPGSPSRIARLLALRLAGYGLRGRGRSV